MIRKTLLIILVFVTAFLIGIAYATTFSFTYDTATPAGSDDPAEADDRMREIKASVQERLAVEHRFALTGTEVSAADTGEHTDITTDSIVNAGTLTNTGTITASGAITVGTTLDVTGNIDPTTYETTNGGFLDEDAMGSDANDKVASQQSIKAYIATLVGSSYRLISVNGTPVKVYTKYFTGTLDADDATQFAHGVASGKTKIYSVTFVAEDGTDGFWQTADMRDVEQGGRKASVRYDDSNIYFINVGSELRGHGYKVKIDYIL